jgi:topoisomerase-4 subunit A
LADVTVFKAEEGLTWIAPGGNVHTRGLKELKDWRGNRADAGRIRPERFLTNNTFGK